MYWCRVRNAPTVLLRSRNNENDAFRHENRMVCVTSCRKLAFASLYAYLCSQKRQSINPLKLVHYVYTV